MALIELDRTPAPDQPLGSRPPARSYRLAGLLLSAVLVLAVGGAAPPGSVLWRYLGLVPVADDPSQGPFRLGGGRVYTVLGDDTDRVVSAWSIEAPPRRLWTARFPARVSGPDQVAFGSVDARPVGGVVLLSDGPATTAVDARTGRTRWTSPVAVQPLAGDRIGLVQNEVFPAGSLYDQDSGAPGELFFSSTGEPHTEAPIRTEVSGIDLATGATAWTVSVGGAVNVFADADVTVLSSDRLARYSGATGSLLRAVPLPRIDGARPSSGEVDGDTVLVEYGALDADQHTLVGYRAGTLERRWSRAEPTGVVNPVSCAGLLCTYEDGFPVVLDPATGRTRWRVPNGDDLYLRGDSVLELRGDPSRPSGVADPATGDVRVDLTDWNSDITRSGGSEIVLRRDQTGGGSAFGVVRPGRTTVQLLGVSRGWVSDCTSDEHAVVCRSDGGLQIWAYRA